ncbi:MAG TPA: HDOD domain-containing protein, partial [Phycisphaerae bacterium]
MTVQATQQRVVQSANDLHQRVTRRLESLNTLPTSVAVAVKLFGLKRGEGADSHEYARVIAADAGLMARILSLANSSWFGLSIRITQPTVAVNLLGLSAVRTLAINFCLSGLHHELHLTKEESHYFWEASLCKAVAARHLAKQLDPHGGEDAYLAGLFQDMALPVMYACAKDRMGPMLEKRMSSSWRLEEESAVYGADHTEFGAMLAAKLGLPEVQVRLVGAHHDLEALDAAGGHEAWVRGVYAASLFPHRLDHWDGGDVEDLRHFLSSDEGGGQALDPFLAAVSRECRDQFAYFDRSKVTEIKFLELVSEATREAAEDAVKLVATLQEMKSQVVSAGETVTRLAQERRQLEEEAARDSLTGVLNRSGFDRESAQAIERSHRDHQPVALLFLDVDRFKEINDVCGHAAGDDALKRIIAVIRDCTRTTDVVGRLGGDEFAVLLPNCPRDKTTEISERIRLKVGEQSVAGRTLSVSLGARWAAEG